MGIKCLQFKLPSGAAGMAAGHTKFGIIKKFNLLIDAGTIGKNIKTKTAMYLYKVWLEKDADYTAFFLVWKPTSPWHIPTVTDEEYKE